MDKNNDKNQIIDHYKINDNSICKLFLIKNSVISQTIIALFDIINKYEIINSTYSTVWLKYTV